MTDELNNLWHTEEYVAEIKTLRAEVERLTGELESAEENANSSHVYWKGAEVRADKAEAKLAEVTEQKDKWYSIAQKVEAKLQQAERERDEARRLQQEFYKQRLENDDAGWATAFRYRKALEEIATTKRGGVDRKKIAQAALANTKGEE